PFDQLVAGGALEEEKMLARFRPRPDRNRRGRTQLLELPVQALELGGASGELGLRRGNLPLELSDRLLGRERRATEILGLAHLRLETACPFLRLGEPRLELAANRVSRAQLLVGLRKL